MCMRASVSASVCAVMRACSMNTFMCGMHAFKNEAIGKIRYAA